MNRFLIQHLAEGVEETRPSQLTRLERRHYSLIDENTGAELSSIPCDRTLQGANTMAGTPKRALDLEDALMPISKRGKTSRPKPFTIYEDATATVDNVTAIQEEELYERGMSKVRPLVALYIECHEYRLWNFISNELYNMVSYIASTPTFEHGVFEWLGLYAMYKRNLRDKLLDYQRENLTIMQFDFGGRASMGQAEGSQVEWKDNAMGTLQLGNLLLLAQKMRLWRDILLEEDPRERDNLIVDLHLDRPWGDITTSLRFVCGYYASHGGGLDIVHDEDYYEGRSKIWEDIFELMEFDARDIALGRTSDWGWKKNILASLDNDGVDVRVPSMSESYARNR